MATRTASAKRAKKPDLKELRNTMKTATGAISRGKAAPKAAMNAARSLRSGDSPAKAAVSGGLGALKQAGERILGNKTGAANKGGPKITNIIEEVDVGAPRRLVYDQWTRFQEFPGFTKKVESTEQISTEKLRWKAKIFWSSRTWESTITEQVPDERIVWRSTGAKGYVDGTVTFHELTPDLTRVLLVLEYHPKGLVERTGNLWRAQGRRVRLELKHFQRHVMTDAVLAKDGDVEGWRGEIRDGEVAKSDENKTRTGSRESSRSTRSGKSSGTGRSSKRSGTKRSSRAGSSSSGSSKGRRSSGERSSTASDK